MVIAWEIYVNGASRWFSLMVLLPPWSTLLRNMSIRSLLQQVPSITSATSPFAPMDEKKKKEKRGVKKIKEKRRIPRKRGSPTPKTKIPSNQP